MAELRGDLGYDINHIFSHTIKGRYLLSLRVGMLKGRV